MNQEKAGMEMIAYHSNVDILAHLIVNFRENGIGEMWMV